MSTNTYTVADFKTCKPFQLKKGSTRTFRFNTKPNRSQIIEVAQLDLEMVPKKAGIEGSVQWVFYANIEYFDKDGFDFFTVLFAKTITGRILFNDIEFPTC